MLVMLSPKLSAVVLAGVFGEVHVAFVQWGDAAKNGLEVQYDHLPVSSRV